MWACTWWILDRWYLGPVNTVKKLGASPFQCVVVTNWVTRSTFRLPPVIEKVYLSETLYGRKEKLVRYINLRNCHIGRGFQHFYFYSVLYPLYWRNGSAPLRWLLKASAQNFVCDSSLVFLSLSGTYNNHPPPPNIPAVKVCKRACHRGKGSSFLASKNRVKRSEEGLNTSC